VGHLDLDTGRLSVVQTVMMVDRTPTLVADTKSAPSRRTFELDGDRRRTAGAPHLAARGAAAVGAKPGRKRLGAHPRGRDDAGSRVAEQGVPATREGRQVARIRLHDLRHSYASSALAAGVPIEVLSKRLGHSRISITQDVYVHTNERQDWDAANLAARRSWGLAPIHDRANG
jgi:integrase